MGITDELKNKFFNGSAYMRLILINVAVFVITGIINLFPFLANVHFRIESYLALPASFGAFLYKPWTLVTYMFMHDGLLHIFFNMIMLYFSGRIFTDLLGDKRLTSVYLVGGLVGALLFLLAYNVLPVFSSGLGGYMVGASAAVLAVFVATAVYAPNLGVHIFVFGPFPLKYVALVLVLIDVVTIAHSNPGGRIAHLGGAAFGLLYASQLKKGRNINGWLESLLGKKKKKPKMKVAHRKKKTDEDYLQDKVERQRRLDLILDKISKSGYDSLTAEEKEILFKVSKDQ